MAYSRYSKSVKLLTSLLWTRPEFLLFVKWDYIHFMRLLRGLNEVTGKTVIVIYPVLNICWLSFPSPQKKKTSKCFESSKLGSISKDKFGPCA